MWCSAWPAARAGPRRAARPRRHAAVASRAGPGSRPDTSPVAVQELADHAGLGAQHHARVIGRGAPQLGNGVLDHDRPSAGQQAGVDPAQVAVVELDLSPGVELGDDLDRQPLARQHPADRVVPAGAVAEVDPVGVQRDEARHRQARAATGGGRCDCGLPGGGAALILCRGAVAAPEHRQGEAERTERSVGSARRHRFAKPRRWCSRHC